MNLLNPDLPPSLLDGIYDRTGQPAATPREDLRARMEAVERELRGASVAASRSLPAYEVVRINTLTEAADLIAAALKESQSDQG